MNTRQSEIAFPRTDRRGPSIRRKLLASYLAITLLALACIAGALWLQLGAAVVAAIGVGFMLLATALGLRVVHAIAAPLHALAQGACSIARGRYDTHFDVKSGDEIGTLATAFNQMAADLDAQRKRAEQALLRHDDELTSVNLQLQQAQNQLLQSEKMASIGQLASGVAHEINNPIGYVQSNFGTLDRYLNDIFDVLACYEAAEPSIGDPALRTKIEAAKQVADLDFVRDDVRALLAQSKDGIVRVSKIVSDLKGYSRSTNDESWQPADVHAGIDSTLNIVWNEIKYKAEVQKQYGALPEIQCRPSQLNQVFMNLLVNAAQAIRKQGTIGIRTGVEGRRIWLEFTDTGEGIDPAHLNRIFEPFFTTKPVGKGTGLGLALAYGIVKDHGGEITVRSVVGEGTVFCVWLPISQTLPASNAQAAT